MNELSNDFISINVANRGAEIQSIRYDGDEYLYQKEEGFWQRQSPILFPIVGRLKNDHYRDQGRVYTILQHGFLRDLEWEFVPNILNTSLDFRITSDDDTRQLYPWDFEVRMRYTLDERTLKVEYTITNESRRPMPFSLGGHPAFQLDGGVNQYSLLFEDDAEQIVARVLDPDEKGILSSETRSIELIGKQLLLSEGLFLRDALIFENIASTQFHLLKGDQKIFTFSRGKFPHFALWKQANAPFLCFEPWQGFADELDASGDLFEKRGMVSLSPMESVSYFWEIIFP